MNVRSMEPVRNTPPVQTSLALLYALAMKDSWRMAVCALVWITCDLVRICRIKTTFLPSDVDECDIIGSCPEHSTCANTFGSFVCTCNEGFVQNSSVCIGKKWCFISETFPLLYGTCSSVEFVGFHKVSCDMYRSHRMCSFLIVHRCRWMSDQWDLSRALHLCKHLWFFCMHLQWRIHEERQCVHR